MTEPKNTATNEESLTEGLTPMTPCIVYTKDDIDECLELFNTVSITGWDNVCKLAKIHSILAEKGINASLHQK